MKIVPATAEHIMRLDGRPSFEGTLFAAPGIRDELAAAADVYGRQDLAFAAVADDGTVVAVAGVIPFGWKVGHAWALLTPWSMPRGVFRRVHAGVRGFLDRVFAADRFCRIQTTVRRDHEEGHRWVRCLGFVRETPAGMLRYNPDGSAADLYARLG